MDSQTPPPAGGDSSSPPSPGVLIVQNGRQAGASRRLLSTLTLIGRAPGCDIRLNVDTVSAQHCAVIVGPSGLVLRDLGSAGGTLVNDHKISSCILKDGDIIAVGPFQLLTKCPAATGEAEPGPKPEVIDALRVQAAAVAAQQAALMEEENRLQQRCVALERQEEQLATHLEARRQEMVALKEQVREQRTQLQRERASLDQERKDCLSSVERDRAEAAQTLARVKQERNRLTELRRRLRRRWKKHWSGHERALEAREKEVARKDAGLAGERAKLEAARTELTRERLRLNGERELTRRELADEWRKLQHSQASWQAERQHLERDLAVRQQRLRDEAKSVQDSRAALDGWREQAQLMRDELTRESQGLETRIRNLRQVASERGASRGVMPPEEKSPAANSCGSSALDVESVSWLARLESLAELLADQRLVMVEQWQRFLETREAWRESHAELLPQLEQAGRELEERERNLDRREQALRAVEESYRNRYQELTRLRQELEAWQSLLSTSENGWKQERLNLLARVEEIEKGMQWRQGRLDEVRKQWSARRKDEVARLMRETQRTRELQRLYVSLREECERQAVELSALQRSLAERSLALEQLELERLGKSEDAAATEKKLQKVRKHYAGLFAESERRLVERGKSLEAESNRLEALAQQQHSRLEMLTVNEAALAARQTEWEHRLQVEEQSREDLQRQVSELRRQEQWNGQRCRELQAELDRLIALLLEDAAPPSVTLAA